MNGRYLFHSLPLITAVVYPLRRCKPLVALVSPRLAPLLHSLLAVPVGRRLVNTLPKFPPTRTYFLFSPLVKNRNPVSGLIQLVLRPLLCVPFPILLDWARCEHDMGVWVSVPLVMQRPVCTHSLFYKVPRHIVMHRCYLFFSAQFARKRYLYLPCKLGVSLFLHCLYCVP